MNACLCTTAQRAHYGSDNSWSTLTSNAGGPGGPSSIRPGESEGRALRNTVRPVPARGREREGTRVEGAVRAQGLEELSERERGLHEREREGKRDERGLKELRQGLGSRADYGMATHGVAASAGRALEQQIHDSPSMSNHSAGVGASDQRSWNQCPAHQPNYPAQPLFFLTLTMLPKPALLHSAMLPVQSHSQACVPQSCSCPDTGG